MKLLLSLVLSLVALITFSTPAYANQTPGGDLILHSGRRIRVWCLSGAEHWVYQGHFSPCRRTAEWEAYRDRRFVRDYGPNFTDERYGWAQTYRYYTVYSGRITNIYACGSGHCKDSARRY